MRRMNRSRVWGYLVTTVTVIALVGCANEVPPDEAVTSSSHKLASTAKVDTLLKVALAKGITVANAKQAMPKKLMGFKVDTVQGKKEVFADVLIKADVKALPKLKQLGVKVRTVTSSGIMTASLPLNKVNAVATLAEVSRIEAAKRVKMYNDESQKPFDPSPADPADVPTYGMNKPASGFDGTGVVVGVIDSGLDWSHKDFQNSDGTTRIAFYWDQSDTVDGNPPAEIDNGYGHEYSSGDINSGNINVSAKDTDGHGTHVTGTAAGNGIGSKLPGVAPKATIVFVKFDFEGDRNSDAAILDGINYIFQKAAAMGKPAVINMSLGSDFGPHDGTTLEERGIDDLTGSGKVVVVAAGNPGSNNWSDKLSWGFAMHGKGSMNQDAVTFRFPAYTANPGANNDYVFFDIWYPAGNKCRVLVTTPTGAKYPPSTTGRSKRTWVTGSSYTGFDTAEGGILVGNGGDQLGWSTTTPDDEVYIEISDYWGTAPATGTWTIELVPADAYSTCSGTYHSWHGVSNNMVHGWRAELTPRDPTPKFGGKESDNAYTIGSPASASKVIAVAAYQSRNTWNYVYGTGNDVACRARPHQVRVRHIRHQ